MSNLNPLLGRTKLPGRVFQLPSKGLFYEQGVLAPDVKNAEIQVKPMSALTEIKIRSADLLYSTKVLAEICSECAPEILKPGSLLSKDVDALFTFLVASTYGSTKSMRASHDCEKADWHDYEIDVDRIIGNPNNKILDHQEVMFSIDLPNGFVVKLKPVVFDDSIELMSLRTEIAHKEAAEAKINTNEVEKILLTDIMATVSHVLVGTGEEQQVVTDRKFIIEWIRTLPKVQLDMIIAAAHKSGEWGFDFKQHLKCRDCNQMFIFDVQLNPISFFTG